MNGTIRSLLVMAFVCAVGACPAEGQDAQRLAVSRTASDPIAIVEGDFDENSRDWLRALSLTVRNANAKPIYGAEFDLVLKPATAARKPLVVSLQYGRPELFKTNFATDKDRALKPEKTTLLKLTRQELEKVYDYMRATGESYPATVMVKLRAVYFGDGSAWKDGRVVAFGGAGAVARSSE
jgi:hypothetical protein